MANSPTPSSSPKQEPIIIILDDGGGGEEESKNNKKEAKKEIIEEEKLNEAKKEELLEIEAEAAPKKVATTKATAKKKKKKPSSSRKRRRRLLSRGEGSHERLLKQLRERFSGGGRRKSRDDLKEAMFDPLANRPLHPDSYNRMMARTVESHLNRLLQPEAPEDLLHSNWLCALCFQPSGSENKLGELFGPYFVRLSADCQPPEQLVPRERLAQHHHKLIGSNNKKLNFNNKRQATNLLFGSLDVWLHGECALWSPELFLVGGCLPGLQGNIQRFWKQNCIECGEIGASIPLAVDDEKTPRSKIIANRQISSSSTKTKNNSSCLVEHEKQQKQQKQQQHFLHYHCAVATTGNYNMNRLIFRCGSARN